MAVFTLPNYNLQPDQVIVTDGQTATVADDNGVTSDAIIGVSGGALTGITLDALSAIIKDGDAITIATDTYTFTVVDGEITNIVVS